MPTPNPSAKYLNVGCGKSYHPEWVNLDLKHIDAQVIQHDLCKGLPFQEDEYDAVYHSHVLEHLAPDEGAAMIRECYRVLKPGGVLRVVVPDLEQIARLYLQQHELACQGDERAKANYDWMKLELIDQMVRRRSGGGMGQFITSPMISNPDFVFSRLGNEYNLCLDAARPAATEGKKRLRALPRAGTMAVGLDHLRKRFRELRLRLSMQLVGLMLGKEMRQACEEGIFRSQGEIHRWMYDRHSLNQLCIQCGFVNCEAKTAFESQIDGFGNFNLDTIEGRVRKPDSLFFECVKPRRSVELLVDHESGAETIRQIDVSAA